MVGLNGIVVSPDFPYSAELARLFPSYVEIRFLVHEFIAIQGKFSFILIFIALAIAVFAPNIYQWLDRFRPALYYRPLPVAERWRISWRPSIPVALTLAAAAAAAVIFAGSPQAYLYWQF
jgi:hypothetical protein